jgi:hypothetical protein
MNVKNRLSLLNIVLLSFFILISSILVIQSHVANIEYEVSETSRDSEFFPNSIVPAALALVAASFFFEFLTAVIFSKQRSQFQSTIPQLLCSNRIALPPPFLN